MGVIGRWTYRRCSFIIPGFFRIRTSASVAPETARRPARRGPIQVVEETRHVQATHSTGVPGPLHHRLARGPRAGRAGAASQGRDGRGDRRVPARQRPARAAVPRPLPPQGHGQPDRLRRLEARGVRRDGHGPPARAPALQGDAHPLRHPQAVQGAGGPVQRHDLGRSDQLFRDAARLRREPGVRHPAGGRPPHQQLRPARGPGHRDDRRAQRVRDGRELADEHPRAADERCRLRVAQLRQVDDRQPQRHRARAHQEPPGILSQALPTRQRAARGGRTVRRGEGPRIHHPLLRCLAGAGAGAGYALHRGAGAGRRAGRHAPSRRRRRRRGGALPRAGRPASGVRGRAGAEPDPDRGPLGTALQGPRRDQEGGQRPRHGQRLARPGDAPDPGRGPQGQVARRRPRHRPLGPGAHRQGRGERRGGRAGAAAAPEGARPGGVRPQPGRHPPERLGRPGRLAALLPRPRPHREGDARAGQGGRRTLPEAEQPDRRPVHPDRQGGAGPDPGHPRPRRHGRGLQGPRGWLLGRVVRRRARPHRGEGPPPRAPRGGQGRPPAQEDPQRVGQPGAEALVRRRREPQADGRGGRVPAPVDGPGHEAAHAAADPGHAGPEPGAPRAPRAAVPAPWPPAAGPAS